MTFLEWALILTGTISLVAQFSIDYTNNTPQKRILGIVLLFFGIGAFVLNFYLQKLDNIEIVNKLDDSIVLQHKSDSINSRERMTLLNKLDSVNMKLVPFVEKAVQLFPTSNQTEALERLYKQLNQQKEQLSAIQNFTDISVLRPDGKEGNVEPPLEERSGLITLLSTSVFIKDDKFNFNCTAQDIDNFLKISNLYPTFPFSYYAIALCYKANNNVKWKDYANKAISILNQTTKISGHHSYHDTALRELKDYLNDTKNAVK